MLVHKCFWIFLLSTKLSLVGCSSQSSTPSHLSVSNGETVDATHSPVRGVRTAHGLCTGFFISPRILITAAHCLGDWMPASSSCPITVGGVKPQACFFHEDFFRHRANGADYETWSVLDVAVAVFPDNSAAITGIAPDAFLKIAQTTPKQGDAVTMFGFGSNWGGLDERQEWRESGAGTLRKGRNKISGFLYERRLIEAEGVLSGPGNGNDAATLHGDSGGPILDASGAVIGVIKGGYPNGTFTRKQSHWVNVTLGILPLGVLIDNASDWIDRSAF